VQEFKTNLFSVVVIFLYTQSRDAISLSFPDVLRTEPIFHVNTSFFLGVDILHTVQRKNVMHGFFIHDFLPHCNENPIYVFLFWELRGLSPNFHIHVSVNDLYCISQDRSTYFLQQNRQIHCWNI
jgi:hypothetical protein